MYTYTYIHIHTYTYTSCTEYRVAKTHRMPSVAGHFSQKKPLIIGLFCRKWPMKIRHPVTLRHPVHIFYIDMYIYRNTYICIHTYRTHASCKILIGHFLQKSPIISGFFAKNDLHFIWGGSSKCCIYVYICICIHMCMYMYVYVYICVYIYICIQHLLEAPQISYMRCVCSICIYTYVCIYIYIYIYRCRI